MLKKQRNIAYNFPAWVTLIGCLFIWELLTLRIPHYLLPQPKEVIQALLSDRKLLVFHAKVTLLEALLGLLSGSSLGVILSILMDHFHTLKKALYPLLILTQTIPTIAIAPLLTVWLGFGYLPKLILITMTIFFPISVSVLDGFSSVDPDEIRLLRSMGASTSQIFWHVKVPASLESFFASFKIAVTYSFIGAVVSEWLGGVVGLGVYMTRVKKAYRFDKMFAVIVLISFLSLIFMGLVFYIEKKCMPWKEYEHEKTNHSSSFF